MREKDLLKIKKDTEMYLEGERVLLHRCDDKIYILSNNCRLCGSSCRDFPMYKDRFRYSYYIYAILCHDWDHPFKRNYLSKLQYDKEILGCL